MQSALLRYLSSKYHYYSILSMMMMLKEDMFCFIVFSDNKNIWSGEKIKSLSQLLRKYDIFMAAILHFSFQKNPLGMTALHRPRYYYGVLNIIKIMFTKAECSVKWDSRISDISVTFFQNLPRDYKNS